MPPISGEDLGGTVPSKVLGGGDGAAWISKKSQKYLMKHKMCSVSPCLYLLLCCVYSSRVIILSGKLFNFYLFRRWKHLHVTGSSLKYISLSARFFRPVFPKIEDLSPPKNTRDQLSPPVPPVNSLWSREYGSIIPPSPNPSIYTFHYTKGLDKYTVKALAYYKIISFIIIFR